MGHSADFSALRVAQLNFLGDCILEQESLILAERPGFGRIFDCGDCGNIHVSVGPVMLTLDPQAYMQLVALVNTSAANFETWLERKHQAAAEERMDEA